MKFRRNIVAIVLCLVMTAAIAGIYLYERNRSIYNMKVYERVIPAQEELIREQERQKAELVALMEQARENYNAAAQAYLPGIAFFGDSLVGDTNGDGMDFRSTVSSLVRSNVCNAATAYINTSANVNFSNVASFLPIVFMGDSKTSLTNTEKLLKKQAKYISGHDRYIIIGPTKGTKAEMEAFETLMTQTYGDRFINIREYMSTNGLASLELEITSEDRAAMNQGRIPPSFLKTDGIHLNDNGTRLLSYLTYERMSDLGYFDEIIEAKQLFTEAESNTN